MPSEACLGCVSWNKLDGWVCCGGVNGLVKVLRMEPPDPATGVSTMSNFSLEGHLETGATVIACCWNEQDKKLTTSDESGLIIVWVRHKGQWHEEMLNNRQRSVVSDMHWAPDGSRICIAYQDGAVIVGKVDGTRVWGKDLGMKLDKLAWSPNTQNILFCDAGGKVFVYDAEGNQISAMDVACTRDKGPSTIAGIDWYDGNRGYVEPGCKCLALCLCNGMLQLMSSHGDHTPVIVDTGLRARYLAWNPTGTIIVVAGSVNLTAGESSEANVLRFYTHTGAYLRQMRIPRASKLYGVSWEGTGLRLAVAADHMLYFVNVRPNYKWTCCSRSLVYAFNRPDHSEYCIMFWDVTSGERCVKYGKGLLALAGHGQYCALLTRGEHPGKHVVIVCNSIGSPVDSRHVHFEPLFLALTKTHVVLANADVIYVWNFCTAQGKLTALENPFTLTGSTGSAYEHIFHIKEGPHSHTASIDSYIIPDDINSMPITAIAASNALLLLARHDGGQNASIHSFSLPDLQLLAIIPVPGQLPLNGMWINCDATTIAMLDSQGTLRLLALKEKGSDTNASGKLLELERKDVWDVRWAEDIPDMMAVMEKTKMLIFRGLEPEPPVQTDSYLVSFGNLEVKMVAMDEVMLNPDEPQQAALSMHEASSLMETRELIESNLEDGFKFVELRPHPRLWQLLGEAALVRGSFPMAIKAFVLKDDYKCLQFIKQVQQLDDPRKQKAEIAAYFHHFEEAEAIYLEMGRTDLAINLHMRLGDWERVKQLIETQKAGDDKLLATVHKNMGQVYMDRRRWHKAIRFFVLSKQSEALVECFFELNDYEDLEELMDALPEGDPILADIARKLESVGLCHSAVKAFVKVGQVQRAIDCCSTLNQWDLACELAGAHGMHAENLLNKQAALLIEQDRKVDVIQLYKNARQHDKAASALVELAKKAKADKAAPLRIKKLYVLAALEVEKAREDVHMARNASSLTTLGLGAGAGATMTAAGTRAAATLQGLVTMDAAAAQGEETMDRAWRGAEAYHFWMLMHRQLYAGNLKAALRTALNLRRYDNVLPVEDIHGALALVAFHGGFYGQCSKAFMKLEALEHRSAAHREALAEVALSIFVNHPPQDPERIEEARDAAAGHELASMLVGLGSEKDLICVASGRVIRKDRDATKRCRRCRHLMIISELQGKDVATGATILMVHCPLCHCDLT